MDLLDSGERGHMEYVGKRYTVYVGEAGTKVNSEMSDRYAYSVPVDFEEQFYANLDVLRGVHELDDEAFADAADEYIAECIRTDQF